MTSLARAEASAVPPRDPAGLHPNVPPGTECEGRGGEVRVLRRRTGAFRCVLACGVVWWATGLVRAGPAPGAGAGAGEPVATSRTLSALPGRRPWDPATENVGYVPGATFHALQRTPDGRPALVCVLGDSLVYGERDGQGSWTVEEITSWHVPADTSHVSYLDRAGLYFDAAGTPRVLTHEGVFERREDVWRLQSVWGGMPDAFAMGPDGRFEGLEIGFFDGSFELASLDPGATAWRTTTLPGTASDMRGIQMANDPRITSLVVDASGGIHAAFVPEHLDEPVPGGARVRSELWYLAGREGAWETRRVHGVPNGAYGDAGLGASIALRPDGRPAIASLYVARAPTGSAFAAQLLYHELGTNGVWTTVTVATAPDGYAAGDGAVGTGFAPHLLFDAKGRPHIAFTDFASQHFGGFGQDEFAGNLRHAWRDGTRWKLTTARRQNDPLRNQFLMPNMVILGDSVAVLGQVRRDQLRADLSVESTRLTLAFVEFVPTDYRDVVRPTVVIASPTPSQVVTNGIWNVRGTATDNQFLAAVRVRLNDGEWTTAGGLTNWSIALPLRPGANQLHAYATDEAGNRSTTNTLTFTYLVKSTLAMPAAAGGSYFPNLNANLLDVGRTYTVSALPAAGYQFRQWIDGAGERLGTQPALSFVMRSNLVLRAEFADVAVPTLAVVSPTPGRRMTNALAVIVGTATDNGPLAGIWCQLGSGPWIPAGSSNLFRNWTAAVPLLVGTNLLRVRAVDAAGNRSLTNSFSVISSNGFFLRLALQSPFPAGDVPATVTVQLSPGLVGSLQASSDALHWTNLARFPGTNAVWTFRDPAGFVDRNRLYRAVVP